MSGVPIKHYLAFLQKQGCKEIEAEWLLCEFLKCDRPTLYQKLETSLSSQANQILETWVKRYFKGEPLSYISGEQEFYGCKLLITPDVLIPRQETEILVDRIVEILRNENLQGKVLWDMCCGSGCIGIALKKRFPELTVILSDLSLSALKIAKKNGERNKTTISYCQGDLFVPFKDQMANYFVCNPPYVSEEEYIAMQNFYEPRLALVGGQEGLSFYERISKELPSYLKPKGKAWLEIGYNQGSEVMDLFSKYPWKSKCLERDWAGHDRFFFLENE